MNIKHIVMLLWSLAMTACLSAAEPLTLDQCLEIGLKNNLRLRNKAIETRIAEAGVSRAEAIYDTHFFVNAQHVDTSIPEAGSFLGGHKKLSDASAGLNKNLSTGTKLGLSAEYNKYVIPGNEFIQIPPYHASLSLSVSQSLLRNAFGSLDRARVEYSEYGKLIAENIYNREKDLLALQICEAYWNLYAASHNHREGLASLGLARELLNTNRKREKDGLLDETDVIAVEALLETRNVEVLALSNSMENASEQLANIIQLPPKQRLTVRFEFVESVIDDMKKELINRKKLYGNALKNRTDVLALKNSIDRAGVDLKMKKNAMKPNLEITGGLSRGDTDLEQGDSLAAGETAWMVGLKLETSLSRKMEKADMQISALVLEKARNDLNDLQDTISLECSSIARACENMRAQVFATDRARKLQEKRLKLEQKKFDQGRSDTRWVIEAQDDHIRMRLLHYRALASYAQAQAGYRVVQGLYPVRRGE